MCDTYASIPKRPQWELVSSDEDEQQNQCSKERVISNTERQDSAVSAFSDDDEKPMIPPKLWDLGDTMSSRGTAVRAEADSVKSGMEYGVICKDYGDDVTVEYSPLHCDKRGSKGSLCSSSRSLDSVNSHGESQPEADGSGSSGYEGYYGIADDSSVLSATSSKFEPDYEQSSVCVDMDQLSLDSSGRKPKRIVETHETHEIIPSENNDDDIVERIIETQTITEKLDDNLVLKDVVGEDYSKYLEDDDEFVSHIFTLGRTLEKGDKKRLKSKDFAFVENPFLPADPVIESMPLEKKTVKQKITTLVKKRRTRDEDNLYADVIPDSTLQVQGQMPSMTESGAGGEWNGDQLLDDQTSANNMVIYETLDDMAQTAPIALSADSKKLKTEKKSIFSGLRKFLKKIRSHDQERSAAESSVVVEDDYQEFVP